MKLYTPGQVLLAAVLASSIGGCWLLAQNFKRLGEPKRATIVLLVGANAAMLMLALGLAGVFRPGSSIGGLLLAIGCHFYAKKVQGPTIDAHVAAGGQLESWWKSFGIGLLVGVALVAAIAFVFAVSGVEMPK